MFFSRSDDAREPEGRSAEIAIRISNLSKCYQIYETPRDRLMQFVMPRLSRLLGMQAKQYFREFWALSDVSFEVRKGETVGIVGRNGSGKSTLLQLICGTLTPSGGMVETFGRVAALLELGSGFNPEFTGRENVYMNASVLGLSKAEIDARFDDIVAFADIGDFIDRPVKTYSSGMYLRLAFAVIAHVDADVLIIDEALAVGDAFYVQKCMRFLRKFMERGAVLFVSHDTGAVVNLCERALWLQDGMLKIVGSPKKVSEAYLDANYQEAELAANPLTDNTEMVSPLVPSEFPDRWRNLIDRSCLRNDIAVFHFDENAPKFGTGGAKIVAVNLLDNQQRTLAGVVGGEAVHLAIEIIALKAVDSPVVGFFVKDRLGQVLFGENTYLSCRDAQFPVAEGDRIRATFSFHMPVLPTGTYSVDAAIAEGTHDSHVQLEWIHDAFVMESQSTSASIGLIGIPFDNVSIRKI